jgi:hypothetical protein
MLRFVQIRNNRYENRLIFFTVGEYEYCFSINILLYYEGKIAYEWFLSILLFGVCKKNCLSCPVHTALLHNFGVAVSF